MAGRFEDAIAAIDAVNAEDPSGVVPDHARRVTDWVQRLAPDAGDALLLAARAHHIKRWTVPRSSYPEGRAGYLRWRRALHEVHALEVARVLEGEGYDPATVARVQQLVRKRNLAADTEVQVLEDALCLVFLDTQLAELADRLDEQKMVDVIAKTLAKMSPDAQAIALTVEMRPGDRALVERALAPPSS